MDVSYTRTQTGSIGVTRTVRRLLEEFQQVASRTGLECHPVAVHQERLQAGRTEVGRRIGSASPSRATRRHSGTNASAGATGGRVRRLALAYLPPSLVHWRGDTTAAGRLTL